jgi:hypothetical protein
VRLYCKGSCHGNCFIAGEPPAGYCAMIKDKFKIETYFVHELFRRYPKIAKNILTFKEQPL